MASLPAYPSRFRCGQSDAQSHAALAARPPMPATVFPICRIRGTAPNIHRHKSSPFTHKKGELLFIPQNPKPPPPWVEPEEEVWVLLPPEEELESFSFGRCVRLSVLYRNRSLLRVTSMLSFRT